MINAATPTWNFSNATLDLAINHIHIWQVCVVDVLVYVSYCKTLLSNDEKSKADKFHFDKDRQRYIVGRAILRKILGQYLNTKPQDIKFQYGQYGKPYLEYKQNKFEIEFNLAHSSDMILYAFAKGGKLGIDIEKIQSVSKDTSNLDIFFSQKERNFLQNLSQIDREKVFYNYWTCKESYVKALGRGLSIPLDQFTISLEPEQKECLLEVSWDKSETARWIMSQLFPASDYAAALTIERNNWTLSYWYYRMVF